MKKHDELFDTFAIIAIVIVFVGVALLIEFTGLALKTMWIRYWWTR